MKYYKLLAELQEETTAYAAAAGASAPSPYTPAQSGKLTGLRLIPSRTAATTLLDGLIVKLTCTTFSPNSIEVAIAGSGLQTAPAIQPVPIDYDVDQPVQAGVPITIESKNVNGSAVTVEVLVLGRFEG